MEEHKKANQFYNKKKYNNAKQIYLELINQDYKKDIMYSNCAACHLQLKNYKEALENSLKAIEINLNYALAWGRVGYSYKGLKMHSHAHKAFDIATKLDKENKIYSNEANFYYKRLSAKLNLKTIFNIMVNNKDLYNKLIKLKSTILTINKDNFFDNKEILDYADSLFEYLE
jgi:tetratricopeptide (TPR) repeat protein